MKSRRAALVALLTTACGGQQNPAGPRHVDIGPPYVSIDAPESQSGSLVLLADGIACVAETYWYRIFCTDPGGESFVFGARGEGPGEFQFPDLVLRGPDCSTPGPRDRQLSGGYAGSGSSLLFLTCYGEYLVWYAHRDDAEPTAIVRTTYVERYPTDREVAAEMQVLQSAPWQVSEDEIRSRPKAWYGPRVVDDRQRFWAVWYSEPSSEVPTPMSYVDVFHLTTDGPRYALTLELQADVLGMDVLGDTLAVLVERDVGGLLPERRVEWYNVPVIE